MTDQLPALIAAFPRCVSARSVSEACSGLVDDLWEAGGLPSVYLLIDGRLRCQAARGYFQVVDGFPPGTGVIGRVVETGEAAIITDVTASEEFIAAIPGLRAEACAPVQVYGDIVGAVSIESASALPTGIDELIRSAADALGASIERAGGLPPVPLAQRLARISVGLTALTDGGEVAARAVEGAVQISGMSSASLSRADRIGRWSVRETCGPLAGALRRWSHADHRMVAGWVRAGTSSHFPGGGAAPGGYEFLLRAGVRALAVQPLVAGGEVTGLLTTADTRFVDHDPTIGAALELLAAQVAGSLATAEAIEELSRRALRDELTGLRNSAAFTEDLRRVTQDAKVRPTGSFVACFSIDVDNFKQVNDTYGHPAGDGLLRELAEVFAPELREDDRLYRVGGDEFAVLVQVLAAAEMQPIAERLLVAARSVRTTVSLGATLCDAPDPETVRVTADRALYSAKSAGRDRAIIADRAIDGVSSAGPEQPPSRRHS